MSTDRKRTPLWLIGFVTWTIAAVFFTGAEYRRMNLHPESPQRVEWQGLGLFAAAIAGLVVMIVQRIRSQPSPEQRAALAAIFSAGPGTIGAVVVTRNGAPEVVATVRSVQEYMELAGSGQLPHDHRVYLPDDLV